MFRVPPLKPGHWWELASWQRFARTCFEYYARRKGFATVLTDRVETAEVSLGGKRARFNPELPPLAPSKQALVRLAPPTDRARFEWTIRGYCAHEAGHVRFSGEKPPGLLGFVVNALEDERLESLQAATFPDTTKLFDFIGDHFLCYGDWEGDALEGCLVWRWQHDFPHTVWRASDPLWDDVRPLVESAWVAKTYEDLVEIARWVLKVLGRDEGEAAPAALSGLSPNGSGLPGDEASGEEPDADSVPDFTDDDLERATTRTARLESDARKLAVLLTPKSYEERVTSHSRGRYVYDRAVRGCERHFVYDDIARTQARRVVMLLDTSASMTDTSQGEAFIDQAVDAALNVLRACEIAGVPLAVYGFDSGVHNIKPFGLAGLEARAAVYMAEAEGNATKLAPALDCTSKALVRDNRNFIVVISDGGLSTHDADACKRSMRGVDANVIPILIGDAAECAEVYRQVFGRYVTLRVGYSLSDLVRTYLRNLL